MANPSEIFDRRLLKRRRDKAASHFAALAPVKQEIADRLADRLEDMARSFPLAIELGCHTGQLADILRGRGGIKHLIQCDLSHSMLQHASGVRAAVDEEALPFAEVSADLVLSAGGLHWVNDLPGALIQIRRILKPDGLFLAILPGAHTLHELRSAFAAVEAQTGTMRPHIAPFVEVRDAGNLLQRAGFALPVVDHDFLTLSYASPMSLLRELQKAGEQNHLCQRDRRMLPRQLIATMCEHYTTCFADPSGRVPATLELLTLTAWAPHASQQQPARRGSGEVNLTQLFDDPLKPN